MPADTCRCDSKPCLAACPCTKGGRLCGDKCHGGRPWASVPCLNTQHGAKVKAMKPDQIRKALCDAGLSPVGDKNELSKRLAVQYSEVAPAKETSGKSGGDSKATSSESKEQSSRSTEELMNVILANEGDYVFILCLSGRMVKATSSKPELRKAYLQLSTKVHPDKNSNSPTSKKAFQAVLEAFESLANPEKREELEEEEGPLAKRKKAERFTRDNKGCFYTRIRCPRCRDTWNTNDLGLEEAAYNFLMQGIKQYICGGCFAKFGCMTALHYCPHCNHQFEYDPDDYHRKISCANPKCGKSFGFMMFKVSEKREKEIRREVKEENEALAKKRAQMKRRAERADKRVGPGTNEERVQEQLFLLNLLNSCPRCGWHLEPGMKMEDAKAHLDGCTDQRAIAAHKARLEEEKQRLEKRQQHEQLQEDVQAYKTWEHNGRQVGQLWMLSEATLRKECKKFELHQSGNKLQLITRLGRTIRDRERKMITMGPSDSSTVAGYLTHDVTPIHRVDEEDLPANWEALTGEELACVAASYNLDFDPQKDVKADLVTKLEKARLTGRGLLMIMDETSEDNKQRKRGKKNYAEDEDPDFTPDDN